jgi:hypothetical protein
MNSSTREEVASISSNLSSDLPSNLGNPMPFTADEAGELAIAFLLEDLAIAPEDQDWFAVLDARPIGETWFVVEVGVEGLPDKWIIQVYDTKECDPSYTFYSPIKASEDDTGLSELPEGIAELLMSERHS